MTMMTRDVFPRGQTIRGRLQTQYVRGHLFEGDTSTGRKFSRAGGRISGHRDADVFSLHYCPLTSRPSLAFPASPCLSANSVDTFLPD